MKTIGVLGGIGPQATMEFVARVHTVAQRLIPAQMMRGYPPLIIYYHRNPPFVMDASFQPQLPHQADPALLHVAQGLSALIDFWVCTSNSPHLVQTEIEQTTGRPVLSMIALALAEVQRRGWRTVGVLGLGPTLVYTHALDQIALPYVIAAAPLRAELDTAIFAVMEGRATAAHSATAHAALASLRALNVDGVILGCTEIPFLLGPAADAPDLLNPLALLAEAAVARAIEADA